MNADDAIEFMLAGATAVADGTANFINPKTTIEIIKSIKSLYGKERYNGYKKIDRST